jgi:hypothetical protein
MFLSHGQGLPSHAHSHRPSAHTLVLDDYDIDALAADLAMRRDELKARLQVCVCVCVCVPPISFPPLPFC